LRTKRGRCDTPPATDVLTENVLGVQEKLRELREADRKLFDKHFDKRLLDVPLYRLAPRDAPPEGVVPLGKDAEKEAGEDKNADAIQEHEWAVVAVTPGGVYQMLKKKWPKNVFGRGLCDLLVLDEASQMNLPEAAMAALALKPDAPLVVVGAHRQMPPIVKHDWDREARRTFRQYAAYESLFDTLGAAGVVVLLRSRHRPGQVSAQGRVATKGMGAGARDYLRTAVRLCREWATCTIV
jgi:hypothetical protein